MFRPYVPAKWAMGTWNGEQWSENFPTLQSCQSLFQGGRKIFRPYIHAKPCSNAACAAAKRAIGTLNGEQLT